jgi:hypothetical protein
VLLKDENYIMRLSCLQREKERMIDNLSQELYNLGVPLAEERDRNDYDGFFPYGPRSYNQVRQTQRAAAMTAILASDALVCMSFFPRRIVAGGACL